MSRRVNITEEIRKSKYRRFVGKHVITSIYAKNGVITENTTAGGPNIEAWVIRLSNTGIVFGLPYTDGNGDKKLRRWFEAEFSTIGDMILFEDNDQLGVRNVYY